jgi:hypothetical protein
LPWEIRRAFGFHRSGLVPVALEDLTPPDSRACKEAEALLDEATPRMVASHCRRTYAWAAALAAQDGRVFDREVVYVASLLHDLYWAKPDALPHPHCFTLPGADRAVELCHRVGWDTVRAHAVADAISLHLNVWPPDSSAEAYLVFVGARLDVVGYRHWDLHPETIAGVIERYPRFALKRESMDGFEAQASANPGTRVHFHTRYLGSKWFTRRAPFDE